MIFREFICLNADDPLDKEDVRNIVVASFDHAR